MTLEGNSAAPRSIRETVGRVEDGFSFPQGDPWLYEHKNLRLNSSKEAESGYEVLQ